MTVEERLANVERILLLKYGTLDYEIIKKDTEGFREFLDEAKKEFTNTSEGTHDLEDQYSNMWDWFKKYFGDEK